MSVFQQARAKVPLLVFMANELKAKQVSTSSGTRQNVCPNPKCSPKPTDVSVRTELFRCFSCGANGDVSAAAAFFWGISPYAAAKRLIATAKYSRGATEAVASAPVDTAGRDDALGMILGHLRSRPIDPVGADWLMSRGINESMIQEAVRRGLLSFLPGSPGMAMDWLTTEIGEDAIRLAGMWREGSRAPAIIFRPVVFPNRLSAEFRLAREPNEREPKALRFGKSEMWAWQGEVPGYAIVSGMLDLFSLAQLGYRGTIYGLPGSSSWNSDDFPDPGTGRAQIVFEGGSSGSSQAEKLRLALLGKGIEAFIKLAPEGTGVNGALTKRVN